MRNLLILVLLIFVIFLSGCIGQPKQTASSVGLSTTLAPDTNQPKASMPVTFILEVKNLASENARDLAAQLLNLTEWRVENSLQSLNMLLPSDTYKFSWIAYSPPTPNRTFMPYANVFYRMETNAKIKLRVYDNDYLNNLKSQERESIKQSSALVSSAISKNAPVAVTISINQPFIITDYFQKFPFVIEIKNVGSGKVYDDAVAYPSGLENYVRFSYKSNSTIQCDFESGSLVGLERGSRSIACRLTATKGEVSKYADFGTDFTVSYVYMSKASAKIEVK